MIKYSEVKDSGERLIGEIPSGWDSRPLKYIFELSGKKNDDGVIRKMLSVSQYHGIIEKEYESEDLRRSEEESKTYWVVEDSNLVVNTMWLNYRGIGVSQGVEGYVSPAYRVYKLDEEKLLPRYTHYLMRSDLYVGIYTKHLKGIRPNSLQVSTYDFQHLIILLPPLEEQKRISKYLDQKTEQIDSLIEKIEKKIELLKEQRTSLINQCVTKGLDPNVEMKDSGIEWIGKIPNHWCGKRLKFISNYSLSSVDRHIHEDERRISICHYPDVYNNEKINSETTLPVGTCNQDEFLKFSVRKGDILITKDSESPDDIGVPCLINENIGNTVCGYHLGIIRSNDDHEPSFIFRFLQSEFVRSHFFCESSGITRFGLGKPSVENLTLNLPPLEEQKRISKYLDQKTEQIDSLVNSENQRIKLLKEYRQSLISSVVTGKVRITEEMVS